MCKNDTHTLIDFIKAETDNLKNIKENVLADIEWIKNKTFTLDKELNNTIRKCVCHKGAKTGATTTTMAKVLVAKKVRLDKLIRKRKRRRKK